MKPRLSSLSAKMHLPQATLLRLLLLAFPLVLVGACNGEKAQDFQVQLFDGGRFKLSEQYAGNVVVINFWYPSCAPCREEMPEFQQAWEGLDGEAVRFLGLFVPRGLDTEHQAREFVAELGLSFDFATDEKETIASVYGIEYYPTTWFIDRGGQVAKTYVSALDADRITGVVRELTAE